MKKRILVLGSTGMLGHQVANHFLSFDEYEVIDIAFRNKLRQDTIILNVMNQVVLESVIIDLKPDFIINCIGVLLKGATNVANAIYLNSYLPHQLKNIASKTHSKLVHFSTDCVFSGQKGQYIESDHRDGQGVYGKTKILGEVIDGINVTLRTSIIGPELKANGEGLFHWFMGQKGSIEGYTKSIWSGVTTLELAKAIRWAVDNEITGIYHITNGHSISKNDLLHLFNKYTKKDLQITSVAGPKEDKSLLDTRKLINYNIPSYEEMVIDLVSNMKLNNYLYPYSGL